MTVKLLGEAKPNDPVYVRGYTINVTPNPPASKKPAAKKPAKPPKKAGK
jgi:hypothetical protein